MTTALALPAPSDITADVVDQYATTVEQFVDGTDDLTVVTDTQARWAAITAYIRRTSREGVGRAEAAARHLDQRVGFLIRAAREAGELTKNGQRPVQGCTASLTDLGIPREDAADFLAMAEHPDIVAVIVAESSDANPPTRNRVRTAIEKHKQRSYIQQCADDLDVMLEERGIVRLTDPQEIAAMERRNLVLAQFHGSVKDVLEVRDKYGVDAVLGYDDDRLWALMMRDTQAAIDFLETIVNRKEVAA